MSLFTSFLITLTRLRLFRWQIQRILHEMSKKRSKHTSTAAASSIADRARDHSEQLNLTTLRLIDTSIERILHTVTHVVCYRLSPSSSSTNTTATPGNEWQRAGVEGPLFVVRRASSKDCYRMIVLNRQSIQNLVLSIDEKTSVEQQSQ